MRTTITSITLATTLLLSAFHSEATPLKHTNGNWTGSVMMENSFGTYFKLNPIRIKVSRNGKVKGTAIFVYSGVSLQQPLKVKGRVGPEKKVSKYEYRAKLVLSVIMPDGSKTSFKGFLTYTHIQNNEYFSSYRVKARWKDYTGDAIFTDL